MGYVLGVDLGTTYTSAAVLEDGGDPHIFSLGDHEFFVPSVLVMEKGHDVVVGEAAERRAATSPECTAREFKRRLGDATPVILDGVPYSPQALMAVLLQWVLDAVTARQGEPPAGVAVTYPANWGEYRKEILAQAVAQVGIKNLILLTEPEAAAVEYAAMNRIDAGGTVGVYDLGGGTFDAAMLRRTSGEFELVGRPVGVEQLGGIDFDEAVFDHVRRVIGDEALDVDLTDPAMNTALHKLRRDCVLAKEALSHDVETTVPVNLPGANTVVRLTRGELEESIRPLLTLTLEAFRRSLESSGLAAEDLSAVLLAGGSSRIPLIAELLSEDLGRPVSVNADPKQIVALGAAIRAHELLAVKTAPAPAPAEPEPKVVPHTRVRSVPEALDPSRWVAWGMRVAAVLFGVAMILFAVRGVDTGGGGGAEWCKGETTGDLSAKLALCLTGTQNKLGNGPASMTVAGITFRVPGQSVKPGTADYPKDFSLSRFQHVLTGPFDVHRRNSGGVEYTALIKPRNDLGFGGLLSVPGVLGVILVLVAYKSVQYRLRLIRRGLRTASSSVLSVGVAGAVIGVGACLIGWTLADHLLTAGLLVVCAVTGLLAGVSRAAADVRVGARVLARNAIRS
ncbi:Hsp70 family protein [Kineosporia sp. J2-2]|uniref:Hsp70 family protein n=1 Tax=Kineosporia corallincola TaxID=2835133 RepID=A0ABS5TAV9_9ACTN|nr:Hsp70 family protein [Kineosporia corallincola]MBT0768210.1 Hsp70 family protein [Kineosporia corallincola]